MKKLITALLLILRQGRRARARSASADRPRSRFGLVVRILGAGVICFTAAATILLTLCCSPRPATDRSASDGLRAKIEEVVEDHGNGLEASVWVGGPLDEPWCEWQSSVPRPAASAVKTALLVEFFAKHSGNLDRALPDGDKILEDDSLLAVSGAIPFSKYLVRHELGSPCPRRLGEVMMGKGSDWAYNAAANVVIADLGGPESATQKIHARDPAFGGIKIRQYYTKAERELPDNEATAASLAAVLRRLATRSVPGVDDVTVEAMRRAVAREFDPVFGDMYTKGGHYSTDPITVVRAGWCEGDRGTFVSVVMTVQPTPSFFSHEMAWTRQLTTTDYLTNLVLYSAWKDRAPK